MSEPTHSKTHPALVAAAVSATVLCLAGTASLLGWIPSKAPAPESTPAGSVVAVPTLPTPVVPPVAETPAAKPAEAVPAKTAEAKPSEPAAKKASSHAAKTPAPARERSDGSWTFGPESSAEAPAPRPAPARSAPAVCSDCGVILSVSEVRVPQEQPSGVGPGAVVGGLLGGVLGNQVGHGAGKALATVIGAAGGAYAGNQIEKSRSAKTVYETSVRMPDGLVRVVRSDAPPTQPPGSRVRIDGDVLFDAP